MAEHLPAAVDQVSPNGTLAYALNPDQIRLSKKGRAVHQRGPGHFLGRGPGDGGKPKSNCAINADQRPKFHPWVSVIKPLCPN